MWVQLSSSFLFHVQSHLSITVPLLRVSVFLIFQTIWRRYLCYLWVTCSQLWVTVQIFMSLHLMWPWVLPIWVAMNSSYCIHSPVGHACDSQFDLCPDTPILVRSLTLWFTVWHIFKVLQTVSHNLGHCETVRILGIFFHLMLYFIPSRQFEWNNLFWGFERDRSKRKKPYLLPIEDLWKSFNLYTL